jgi:hypothetical protein
LTCFNFFSPAHVFIFSRDTQKWADLIYEYSHLTRQDQIQETTDKWYGIAGHHYLEAISAKPNDYSELLPWIFEFKVRGRRGKEREGNMRKERGGEGEGEGGYGIAGYHDLEAIFAKQNNNRFTEAISRIPNKFSELFNQEGRM